MAGNELPHSIELERSFLGGLLTWPELRDELGIVVSPEDLYNDTHRALYRALLEIPGRPDIESVLAYLGNQGDGLLEKAGGEPYIRELPRFGMGPYTTEQHARQLRELGQRRRFIIALGKAVGQMHKGDVDGALMQARRAIGDVETVRTESLTSGSWADLDGLMHGLQWAWPGYWPKGFLTLLGGQQAAGKSMLALWLCRSFLTGEPWPDGASYQGEPGEILWLEAESSQGLNWMRAVAWGLPRERIRTVFDDPLAGFFLDDPNHRKRLTALAWRHEIRAVILDSLSGAHRRSEKDHEMLELMTFLADLARDTGKPILASHHPRKRTIIDVGEELTLEMFRGSNTITQPSRMVLGIDMPDPGRPGVRRLRVLKTNLGVSGPDLGFTIDDAGLHFCVAPQPAKKETQTDKAKELLLTLLDCGPVAVTEIEQEMKGAGISWRTAVRAKDELNIIARRIQNRWVWALPHKE